MGYIKKVRESEGLLLTQVTQNFICVMGKRMSYLFILEILGKESFGLQLEKLEVLFWMCFNRNVY